MECHLTADSAGSTQALAQVFESLPAGEVFVQDDPVLRRMVEVAGTARQSQLVKPGRSERNAQATVTLAEALVAQTGSIFVTASCGGRGASVVAPVHIVYATTEQLVPRPRDCAAQCHSAGTIGEEFLCLHDQRLQPYGGH